MMRNSHVSGNSCQALKICSFFVDFWEHGSYSYFAKFMAEKLM